MQYSIKVEKMLLKKKPAALRKEVKVWAGDQIWGRGLSSGTRPEYCIVGCHA